MLVPPAIGHPGRVTTTPRAARLVVAFAGALLACSVALAPGGHARADQPALTAGSGVRPNILVVMTDDQDARSMWAMPRVRRLLMQRGTRFPNSFASFSTCCPSRATFLTGQHAHNHGVLGNLPPKGGYTRLDGSSTLPVWLRRAGYRTVHVGKYLNGYGQPGNRNISERRARREVPSGWSRWLGLVDPLTYRMYGFLLNRNRRLIRYPRRNRHYQTDVLARHATRLIRRLAPRRRPLFIAFNPLAPHGNTDHAKRGVNPTPAPRHRRAFRRKSFPRPPSFNEKDVSDKPLAVRSLPRLNRATRREMRRRWLGRMRSLLAVDQAVARMVRALRRAGELGRTLVVFTSDNGVLLGEHRVPHAKARLYEESARVPLILRGPGVPAGATRPQITSNTDLAATILDAAGVEPRLAQDGISLLPLARDPQLARSRAILLEDLRPARRSPVAGVRARGWTYVDRRGQANELYEMATDPFQLQSLHNDPDHRATKLALETRLAALRDCAGAGCYQEYP